MPGIIVPFVGEPHRDTISIVRPKLFDQPVVQFFRPFACEKFNDLLPRCGKFSAISLLRVDGVCKSDLFWIARIPAVLRQTDLLDRSLTSKWRQRRTRCWR
jgi:hypothetical protein